MRTPARAQAQGLLRCAPGAADRHATKRPCAHCATRSACVRSTSASTPARPNSPRPPLTCIRPTRTSARPTRPTREDHRARRRSEPDRPGHRVRLLLRARGARAARRRFRDHHGQLQPGDRVDRLRHLRSPVLRAADARGRARDRRSREAEGRDRAVRRPDATEAGAMRWKPMACR